MISKRAAARFAFVALLALVVFGGIYLEARPRSLVTISSRTPSYTLTADQFLSEYKADEVAADNKYTGKVLLISGPIRQNGKFIDTVYILIGGYGLLNGVRCMFGESGRAESLSKGSQVTVKGEVSSKKGNVFLRKCPLE